MGNFIESIVNQRFRIVFSELEHKSLIKGKSDIANHLGTYNHVVNSILKGKRNITIEQLNKLFDIFNVNANYMFGISEEMFLTDENGMTELPSRALSERSSKGKPNITLVPHQALAGYAMDVQNTDYEPMEKFSIPGLSGELIAFEISGDSMQPTITNSDIIVSEKLDRGEPIRDNQVYIVVTDVVVAKRVQQIKEGSKIKKLRLISDNQKVFKPYEVNFEEVRQLLRVKCRLTTHAIA